MKRSTGLGAGVDALISQRTRGHLIYRAVSRGYGVHAALSTASIPRRAAALTVGWSIDIGQWAWLDRTPDLKLVPRALMDAADIWAFSRTVEPSPEAAMLVGVPLAAEAGARFGIAGMGVPAFQLAVASAIRRRAGLRTPVASVLPQVQAAAFGAGCGTYSRRVREQIAGERQRETAAYAEAAELAGQHEVALHAGSVVDQVAGIEYLVAVAGNQPVGTGRSLARWKASLAAAATSDASYLRVVANRWASARQTNVLGDDVQLDMDEATGSTVLTRTQADQLTSALDALAPKGRCPVRVQSDTGPGLIGEAVEVHVGRFRVVLRRDEDPVRRIEPGPAMIAAGMGWCLAMATRAHGAVPLPLAASLSLGSIGLGGWAHRRMRSAAPPAPEQLVALAVGVATAQALVGTLAMASPRDHDGIQVFPAVLTLMAPAFLAGRYHQTLDPAARARVAGMFAASIAVSLLPARRPIEWRHAAAGVTELVAAYLLLSRIQGALNDDQERLEAQFDQERHEQAAAARERGRRRALELVDAERRRLVVAVRDVKADELVPASLRIELERRLDEVAIDLAGLA